MTSDEIVDRINENNMDIDDYLSIARSALEILAWRLHDDEKRRKAKHLIIDLGELE